MKMVFETVLQSGNFSTPRPNSLLLKPVSMEKNKTEPSWEDMAENTLPVGRDRFDSTGSNTSLPARRKKKKRAANSAPKSFRDLYEMTGESLGVGATGSVETYRDLFNKKEYAVKTIKKGPHLNRKKVLKEIEIFHQGKGHPNILQLIEYYEEDDSFYLVFEKMEGGSLLEAIEHRGHLTEQEASLVIKDLAKALGFLHKKGIAHRDLKPENILCLKAGHLTPVKICDFDLGSGVIVQSQQNTPTSTPELLTPVGSAEYMAPEVVDVWQDQAWSYDKRCDIWSLGIIMYMLLCGYPPFYGQCGQDCGWERGENCEACQENLFARIQEGFYDFPEVEWCDISEDAKDLISRMLVRDPHRRCSAEQVLLHPWIAKDAPRQPLATPYILHRNHSVCQLQNFAENANACHRMLQSHISISEAFCRQAYTISSGDMPWDDDENANDGSYLGTTKHFIMEDLTGDDSGIGSGESMTFSFPKLSPPGESGLARRRRATRMSSDSSDEMMRSLSISPPKTPSAIF
jgi:MAP kinase interacting serine/threonine kinase